MIRSNGKILIGLVVPLISGLATAKDVDLSPKVAVEFRSSLETNDSDDDSKNAAGVAANKNGELNSVRFVLPWARLSLYGDFDDKTGYFFQLIYLDDVGTLAPGDAMFTHRITKDFNVDFGNMYLLAGGYEGYLTPEANYSTSLAASNTVVTEIGARATYKVAGQEFKLSFTNGGKEKNQKTLMPGFLWMGGFGSGGVKFGTNVSYFLKTNASQSNSPSGVADRKKTEDSFRVIAVNASVLKGKLNFELGNLVNTYGAQEGDDSEDSSNVAQIHYTMGAIRLGQKFEASTASVAGKDLFTRNAYVTSVEYYPGKSKHNYYHLAYVSQSDEYKQDMAADADSGTTTRMKGDEVTTTKILVGVTMKRWW